MWVLHNIKGDGNCLFRAIAQGYNWKVRQPTNLLFARNATHPNGKILLAPHMELELAGVMRALAVQELSGDEYNPYFYDIDKKKYLNDMSNTSPNKVKWGGDREIAALAKVLRTCIVVYQLDRSRGVYKALWRHGPTCPARPSASISLIYDRGGRHYNLAYWVSVPRNAVRKRRQR